MIFNTQKDIFVTKPFLPPLHELYRHLSDIWNSSEITNCGKFHKRFESELSKYLDIPFVSLFNNCTTALLVSLKAFDLKGDVLTTPFTFAASYNSIIWSGLNPVFVDINPNSLNIDVDLIEKSITKDTSAILPVHAYGYPCEIDSIQSIAQNHGLKVIYDGAAAFGSKYNNKSVLAYGDISVVSFHATKVLNTFEGGAIFSSNIELKEKIDKIRNFGLNSENELEYIGINGKLNEFSSALGILQLKYYEKVFKKRKDIVKRYNSNLSNLSSIVLPSFLFNNSYNSAYYPILIKGANEYSRDFVYEGLKSKGIYTRKYYDQVYKNAIQHQFQNVLEACPCFQQVAKNILCLPIYPDLKIKEQKRIICELKSLVNLSSFR